MSKGKVGAALAGLMQQMLFMKVFMQSPLMEPNSAFLSNTQCNALDKHQYLVLEEYLTKLYNY